MISETQSYSVGERKFSGQLIYSSDGREKRPGVLVLHEGDGLGPHTIEQARELAALGYVAFAPDLYGEKFTSREQGIAAIAALVADSGRLRDRVNAALAFLKLHRLVDPARTAAVGFCFGGLAALELARSGSDVRGVVCFHGGLATRAVARRDSMKARILVCTGADDPHVLLSHRAAFEEEMIAAGADWQMLVLGGAGHGFTNRTIDPAKHPGSGYHPLAHKRGWVAMRGLLNEVFERQSP